MIKKVLLAVLVIIVVFVIIVATRPGAFRVTRSATIAAPADVVFAQVNDLHKWEAWSPWAKLDPNAKITFEGPVAGVGAGYTWAGNSQVGEGRMTISESRANELIRFNLEFLKPMQMKNAAEFTFKTEGKQTSLYLKDYLGVAEFTFKTEGKQTAVTWSMSGTNGFIGKAFSLFVNCDKMVGPDFEKGLAQLKTVSEAAAPK